MQGEFAESQCTRVARHLHSELLAEARTLGVLHAQGTRLQESFPVTHADTTINARVMKSRLTARQVTNS